MSDRARGILLDIMSMHTISAEYGCGLDPHLLEMLQDRHATPDGCLSFPRGTRHGGPVQPVIANPVGQGSAFSEVHYARR